MYKWAARSNKKWLGAVKDSNKLGASAKWLLNVKTSRFSVFRSYTSKLCSTNPNSTELLQGFEILMLNYNRMSTEMRI